MLKMVRLLPLAAALVLAACGGNVENKSSTAEQPKAAPAVELVAVPDPLPAAKTASETADCMKKALAAEPFKGSMRAKLKQARRLAANTTVTINGTQTKLAAGETVWSKCSGPSELEVSHRRIEILSAQLINAERKLAAATARIDDEMFANAGRTLTWKQVAEAETARADNNRKSAIAFGIVVIMILIIAIVAVVLYVMKRRGSEGAEAPQAPASVGK